MHVHSAGIGEKGGYNFTLAHCKKHNKLSARTHTYTHTHTHKHTLSYSAQMLCIFVTMCTHTHTLGYAQPSLHPPTHTHTHSQIHATYLQYTCKSIQAVANSNVNGFTKYPVTSLRVGYDLKHDKILKCRTTLGFHCTKASFLFCSILLCFHYCMNLKSKKKKKHLYKTPQG